MANITNLTAKERSLTNLISSHKEMSTKKSFILWRCRLVVPDLTEESFNILYKFAK